jgi:hypothetical protein
VVDVNKGIINYGSIGGDARVRSDVRHTGDNVSTHALGSNVNVKSGLENSAQTACSDASQRQTREKLNELIEQLKTALSHVPDSHREGADAVVSQAKSLASATTAQTPNKTFVQVTADGLKSAAKFVADVAPSVGGIVSGIVSILGTLSGI